MANTSATRLPVGRSDALTTAASAAWWMTRIPRPAEASAGRWCAKSVDFGVLKRWFLSTVLQASGGEVLLFEDFV